MKEFVNVSDYANAIDRALPKGILMNTQVGRFNSMVIGWGGLGRLWNRPVFTAYVRQSRYTKELLDASGEFSISVPLGRPDPEINRVCGRLSGRDVDKAAEAGLTLEPPEVVRVPGVREYPLTLECRVLYRQDQEVERLPEDIRERLYSWIAEDESVLIGRDAHTMYVGEIVSAYVIVPEN